MEGKTQETAAAKAGICVRSARNWQSGPLPSETKQERQWRTRSDPFEGVWEEEIEPLLQGEAAGKLKATTIIEWLEEQHPSRFSASQLRTLQRRLQDWRALHGPDQEVYFPQEHPPGREAQFDFTHGSSLGVTVAGRPYRHQLFQLILSHSGWRYAELANGETFLALQQGLQAALWTLGGVPQVVRSDNTSAATHEMRRSGGRALNDNYAALLEHYGLRSTRINPGQSHENGFAFGSALRPGPALHTSVLDGILHCPHRRGPPHVVAGGGSCSPDLAGGSPADSAVCPSSTFRPIRFGSWALIALGWVNFLLVTFSYLGGGFAFVHSYGSLMLAVVLSAVFLPPALGRGFLSAPACRRPRHQAGAFPLPASAFLPCLI